MNKDSSGLLKSLLFRKPLISSFILGLLVPLAFAPFGWFWVLPIVLSGLFLLQLNQAPRQAMKIGFVFGIAAFGVGVSWVYVSLHTFGGMPAPLAAFCVLVFVAIYALFPTFGAYLYSRFCHSNKLIHLMCVVPTFWVIPEILRNYLFGGFPWLEAGYSLSGTSIDIVASLTGIHGLSFIVVLQAGCLATFFASSGIKRLIPLSVLISVFLIAKGVSLFNWTIPHGDPINVALVQSVIPIETKWDSSKQKFILDKYFSLSSKYQDVDLIVWPEAAIASSLDQLDAQFFERLQLLGKPLLAGFVERGFGDNVGEYYNAAALFDAEPDIYRKQHLVPFGEYMPLKSILDPITNYLNIPNSSMSAWNEPQSAMYFKGHRLGVGICFEEAFPADMRSIAKEADVLINLSEDAWFGRSLGPHQRLQMAQIRAIETGRPSLRSSNTALTSLINYKGRIVAMTEAHQEDVLRVVVQPRKGQTAYMRFGDIFIFLILGLGCLISLTQRRLPIR